MHHKHAASARPKRSILIPQTVPIHDGVTGVEEEVMVEEATFLAKLWSAEFVNHPNLDIPKVFFFSSSSSLRLFYNITFRQ